MKKAFLLIAPLLLIGGAIIVASQFNTNRGRKLELGNTYEVWLKEAEVSSLDHKGEKWDTDGSAPDLRGMMSWQGQVVLKTVQASDGLIARWSDTAISASQAFKGEVDTQSLQRVGRIRMDSSGFIEFGIFDDDLVSEAFAGGFRIPLSSLRLGNNRVNGSGALKTIVFRVSETDSAGEDHKSNEEWKLTDGVLELHSAPSVMKSASERLLDEAGNALNQYSDKITLEFKKQSEAFGEELEKGMNEAIQNLQWK